MSVKTILILCAQALLVKSAFGQSISSRAAVADVSALTAPCGLAAPARAYDGIAYSAAGFAGRGFEAFDGLNAGCAGRALAYDAIYAPVMEFSPTSGGALPVSSASTIAPVGISVVSDNVYEGILAVGGELPFVGTVAMEGVVPSAGAGAVNHACGNGRNAMISENAAFAPAAYGPATVIAPAAALSVAAPLGYRAGLNDLAYPGVSRAGAFAPAAIAAPGLGYRGGCASNFGCAI